MAKIRNCPHCYGTGSVGRIGRCSYCHGKRKVLSDFIKWEKHRGQALVTFEQSRQAAMDLSVEEDIKKWDRKHPKPRKFPKTGTKL